MDDDFNTPLGVAEFIRFGKIAGKIVSSNNVELANFVKALNGKYLIAGNIGIKEDLDALDFYEWVFKCDKNTAIVDLKDLKEGTWEVPVTVKGSDNKLVYTSRTNKVKIVIKKK